VNLTGALQLGITGRLLVNTPFVGFIAEDEDRKIFYTHKKEVFTTEARQSCEIRLRKKGGMVFYDQLQSGGAQNIDK